MASLLTFAKKILLASKILFFTNAECDFSSPESKVPQEMWCHELTVESPS